MKNTPVSLHSLTAQPSKDNFDYGRTMESASGGVTERDSFELRGVFAAPRQLQALHTIG